MPVLVQAARNATSVVRLATSHATVLKLVARALEAEVTLAVEEGVTPADMADRAVKPATLVVGLGM